MIRKTLLGVSPLVQLGPEGYEPAVTRRVYQTVAQRAAAALKGGHTVVADAVYASPHEREEIAAVARGAGVPFVGLWIDGTPEVLARRLGERVKDASDATAGVLQLQLRTEVGRLDWHRLDGSADVETVQRSAEVHLPS